MSDFRTKFGEDRFYSKGYSHQYCETWPLLAETLAHDVCGAWLHRDEVWEIARLIRTMKFVPAGRYLYYAGRKRKFFNNCIAMIVEDTREGWAELMHNATAALMGGAGIGVFYGKLRPRGSILKSTGGQASGPIPLAMALNDLGRQVKQGGNRRSACWAGLPWNHPDREEFLTVKNWSPEIQLAKSRDFNFPAPLDMTNISLCFDDAFLENPDMDLLYRVVRQMCMNGEPGMAFNFGIHALEVGRNACTEHISPEDSDPCNLGAVNIAQIESWSEMCHVSRMAAKFLFCGSLVSELPYAKAEQVRKQHRKIGLGLMGVHEWLLQRGYRYEMVPELHQWAAAYRDNSQIGADAVADNIGIPRAERYRAIAPTGTISLLAGTTSGIEPIFAVAMRRRYLGDDGNWKSEYLIDPTAEVIGRDLGVPMDDIETAYDLARDPERRIKFQADMQKYVDMGISSTVNMPKWGSKFNNEDRIPEFSRLILKYMPHLRGITAYPDDGRSGQTLTVVPYKEAKANVGTVYDEQVAMDQQCTSGVCSM